MGAIDYESKTRLIQIPAARNDRTLTQQKQNTFSDNSKTALKIQDSKYRLGSEYIAG
jgi:hypothetical protein